MREYTTRAAQQAQTDVPTVQPIYLTSGGTAVVVFAMLLLTIIVIYITSQNAESAPYGIVGSVVFFLVGTPIGLLAVNGGLAQMWGDWQREKTVRKKDEQEARLQAYYAQQTYQVVQPSQLPYTEPTERLQPAALPQSPSFVPAVPLASEQLKAAAGGWATQLFDTANGRPLPNRITKAKGQIQIKSPEPEVVEYLASLGIVRVGNNNQLYWNGDEDTGYPTLRHAINAIRRGLRTPSSNGGNGGGYRGVNTLVGEVTA